MATKRVAYCDDCKGEIGHKKPGARIQGTVLLIDSDVDIEEVLDNKNRPYDITVERKLNENEPHTAWRHIDIHVSCLIKRLEKYKARKLKKAKSEG
jgi:hypothetical protein